MSMLHLESVAEASKDCNYARAHVNYHPYSDFPMLDVIRDEFGVEMSSLHFAHMAAMAFEILGIEVCCIFLYFARTNHKLVEQSQRDSCMW